MSSYNISIWQVTTCLFDGILTKYRYFKLLSQDISKTRHELQYNSVFQMCVAFETFTLKFHLKSVSAVVGCPLHSDVYINMDYYTNSQQAWQEL